MNNYKIEILEYKETISVDFSDVAECLRFTQYLLVERYGYTKGTIYYLGWDKTNDGIDETYYVQIDEKTKTETKVARLTTKFDWSRKVNEQDWLEGNRSAWKAMLTECLRQLEYHDTDGPSWIVEREAVIAMLREACTLYGNNDWKDQYHLGDVVENLIDSLQARDKRIIKSVKALIQAAKPFLDDRTVDGTWGVVDAQDTLATAIESAENLLTELK